MCSNGQYAAFSVTYPKTTSSSLLNAPKQHTIQTRSPARKNITRKLLFRVNTSLFGQPNGKVTLVCGQHTGVSRR